VQTRIEGDCLLVELGGRWRITEPRPSWVATVAGRSPTTVKLVLAGDIGAWDSALLLFINETRQWCRETSTQCDLSGLPNAVQRLIRQFTAANEECRNTDRSKSFLTVVGLAAQDVWGKTRDIATFVGECALSAGNLAKRPGKFRWRDCLE